MFCKNCGKELPAGTEFCPNCGTPANGKVQPVNNGTPNKDSGMYIACKVLMILTIIAGVFAFLIPLLWLVPMYKKIKRHYEQGEFLSTGFKVSSSTLLYPSRTFKNNDLKSISLFCRLHHG